MYQVHPTQRFSWDQNDNTITHIKSGTKLDSYNNENKKVGFYYANNNDNQQWVDGLEYFNPTFDGSRGYMYASDSNKCINFDEGELRKNKQAEAKLGSCDWAESKGKFLYFDSNRISYFTGEEGKQAEYYCLFSRPYQSNLFKPCSKDVAPEETWTKGNADENGFSIYSNINGVLDAIHKEYAGTWSANGGENQKWQFFTASYQTGKLYNAGSSNCLDFNEDDYIRDKKSQVVIANCSTSNKSFTWGSDYRLITYNLRDGTKACLTSIKSENAEFRPCEIRNGHQRWKVDLTKFKQILSDDGFVLTKSDVRVFTQPWIIKDDNSEEYNQLWSLR